MAMRCMPSHHMAGGACQPFNSTFARSTHVMRATACTRDCQPAITCEIFEQLAKLPLGVASHTPCCHKPGSWAPRPHAHEARFVFWTRTRHDLAAPSRSTSTAGVVCHRDGHTVGERGPAGCTSLSARHSLQNPGPRSHQGPRRAVQDTPRQGH